MNASHVLTLAVVAGLYGIWQSLSSPDDRLNGWDLLVAWGTGAAFAVSILAGRCGE